MLMWNDHEREQARMLHWLTIADNVVSGVIILFIGFVSAGLWNSVQARRVSRQEPQSMTFAVCAACG